MRNKKKPGPKPTTLKLTGNWEANVRRALHVKPSPRKRKGKK